MKKKYLLYLLIFFITSLVASVNPVLKFQISGVEGEAEKNVLQALKDLQNDNKNDFYKQAPTIINNALQPYGYFRSQVWLRLQQQNHTRWVYVTIRPGPVMCVTQVNIKSIGQGRQDPHLLLAPRLLMQPGDALNTVKFTAMKQALLQRAANRGYFKAKIIKSLLIINLRQYTAQIQIIFDTGPRYYFGRTIFVGSSLHSSFLKKFLTYRSGEPYLQKNLQKVQEALTQSNYFQEVTVSPEISRAKNLQIPIYVYLQPRKKKQYVFGLGYGTDTGIRATAEVNVRQLNNYGHRFNTQLEASSANSSLMAHYIIPGPNPVTDQFVMGGGIGHLQQASGSSNSAKIALSFSHKFYFLQQTIALNFLKENYQLVGLPFTDANLIYPSVTWTKLISDKKREPTRGINATIKLAGAPNFLTSKQQSGFFQERVDLSALYTLPTHTRLQTRISYGHTSIAHLENLPLSLQLLAGGAVSIRGYAYNSIGPGRNLFVTSFEMLQRIKGNWYVGGFIDAGNVTNGNPLQQLQIGAGPSIAWLSPFGTIEAGMARAFQRPQHPWSFVFSMGPAL